MKHRFTTLLLASTSLMVASAALAQGEIKPSVEVHLEALDALMPAKAASGAPSSGPSARSIAEAQGVVSPAPIPETPQTSQAASAPERRIINQRAIIPLNQLSSRNQAQQARQMVDAAPRRSRESTGGDLPRHSSVFSSKLQPLAPAPTMNGYTPPPRRERQVVRIAPPYGASAAAPAAIAPVSQPSQPLRPAPDVVPQQEQPVVAQVQEQAPVLASAPETPAPETVEKPAVQPAWNQPDVQQAPIPPSDSVERVEAASSSADEETSWWDDATSSVSGLFTADERDESAAADTKPQPPIEGGNQAETAVARREPFPAPSSDERKPIARVEPSTVQPLLTEPPMMQEPPQEKVTVAQAAPAPEKLQPVEAPAPVVAQGNAASYDGLEMAEGFALHGNVDTSAGFAAPAPASALSPPAAEVALPVPVAREGEEVVLAQASEGPQDGLVDPFQEGTSIAPEPAVKQPIPAIVPESPAAPQVVASSTAPEPVAPVPAPVETSGLASTPVPMAEEKPAPAGESAQPTAGTPPEPAAKEDSSWMDDLQNSLTGYFSDEAPVSEARSNARPPVENPVASSSSAAVVAAPPAVDSTPPALPVPPALPPLPEPAQAKDAPDVSSSDVEKSMVELEALPPLPENPSVLLEGSAQPAQATSVAGATAPDLPSLTKLTGDPEVIKETETKRVASADIPPPPVENKPAQVAHDQVSAPVAAPPLPPLSAPSPQAEKKKPEPEKSATQVPEVTVSASAPTPPSTSEPELKGAFAKTSASQAAPAAEAKAETVDMKVTEGVKESKPVELARLPAENPVVNSELHGGFSLSFTADSKTLPQGADTQLNGIAEALKGNDSARVNLKAFATGEDDAKAKRISLSRGLAVRNYLIDKGVSPLRINLLPLGNKHGEGNPERVDVELVNVGAL